MGKPKHIEQAYRLAKERYAALGVDTDKALKQLARIPISIHCWQGDDVGGFELASGHPDEIVYNDSVRRVYLGEHFRM